MKKFIISLGALVIISSAFIFFTSEEKEQANESTVPTPHLVVTNPLLSKKINNDLTAILYLNDSNQLSFALQKEENILYTLHSDSEDQDLLLDQYKDYYFILGKKPSSDTSQLSVTVHPGENLAEEVVTFQLDEEEYFIHFTKLTNDERAFIYSEDIKFY